jgi:hypothetical protein
VTSGSFILMTTPTTEMRLETPRWVAPTAKASYGEAGADPSRLRRGSVIGAARTFNSSPA